MSVVEYVRYRVPIEQADEFVAVWRSARPMVQDVPGHESMELRRGVEDPTDFFARVTWTTIEDHFRFREAPEFAEFKGRFVDFTVESVSHYEAIPLDSPCPPTDHNTEHHHKGDHHDHHR